MALPTVALVGRPNVGKSTLFNRIVGTRLALVDDQPGVTRDRLEGMGEWLGRRFRIVDTGGLELARTDDLPSRVREQSLRAVDDADVVVLVVDLRAGPVPDDAEAARLLGRTGKPIVVAVNKVDGDRQEAEALEFHGLGLEKLATVSAEHGRGIGDLLDLVIERLPEGEAAPVPTAVRLALVGRPNAGKSSLTNRILGAERMVVDAAPGTTRDPVDVRVVRDGVEWILVDTAGIRRKSRIDRALEHASVARALRAAERAHVVLLVVDASEGVTDQDARLARLVWERGRALVVVMNKWDLLPRERRRPAELAGAIREAYAHLRSVPIVFVSALEGTRIDDVFAAAKRTAEAFSFALSTRGLNEVVEAATSAHEAPVVGGKRGRVYYAAPLGSRPPTIAFFVNDPEIIPESYVRFLENRIRETFPLEGTPLRIKLRARPRRPATPRRKRTETRASRRGSA